MADQSSGLRFDIYERVQLSEEIEGIHQLEEIELIPQIELTTQDQQAVLKGNLILSGNYLGDQDARSMRNLEHIIPVEITLPMNRIHDLDNIGVEIENFDINLISARSLNVTGVLSLKGVDTTDTSKAEMWKEEDDELVFVHQAEEQIKQPIAEENRNNTDQGNAKNEEKESRLQQDTNEEPVEAVNNDPVEQLVENSSELKDEEIETESSDMKIAFNSRPMELDTNETQPQQFQTLIHSDTDPRTHDEIDDKVDDNHERSEEDTANPVKDSTSTEAEWKNLFLNREDEEHKFSKMRMCIIQKEETIETIAERYNLNSREILLYNRLSDQEEVSEGQIIYIP